MALILKARPQTLIRKLTQVRSKSSNPIFSDSDIVSGSETRDGVKPIEDLLRCVFVECCAPDWIDFVPGTSYWVPPHRKAMSVVAAGIYMTARSKIRVEEDDEEEEEEILELITSLGWPSKSYFLLGISEQEMKFVSQSDDEE